MNSNSLPCGWGRRGVPPPPPRRDRLLVAVFSVAALAGCAVIFGHLLEWIRGSR